MNTVSRLYQAHIDYGVMERHCELVTRSLKAELDDLESIMDARLKGKDEHFQDWFYREVNDYWIETAQVLPRLQWYAQLLAVFAYFEKTLNDVCASVRSERDYVLSLNDIRGQGISRAQIYLSKVALLAGAFTQREWQFIKALSEIRNAVAHCDGFVDYEPDKRQSLYMRVSTFPGIVLDREIDSQEHAQIVFDAVLVISALQAFKAFTERLIKEFKAS